MKRYVSLEEISDGKLYASKDMVKADCLGCKGCSKCCRGMGESIILDLYDIYLLKKGLGKSLTQLMEEGSVSLGVVDGVILPHLSMRGPEEKCSFLNEEGRCGIHEFRPGFCRLFPLGRYYENGSFRYFLQTGECDRPKAKIKIEKWLGIKELQCYEEYVNLWHSILLQAEELLTGQEDAFQKNLTMFFLKTFFLRDFDSDRPFYDQFEERLLGYREIVS